MKSVRHSVVLNDETALEILQNKNWQYLIERILEACQLITVVNWLNWLMLKKLKSLKTLLKILLFVNHFIQNSTIRYQAI